MIKSLLNIIGTGSRKGPASPLQYFSYTKYNFLIEKLIVPVQFTATCTMFNVAQTMAGES